MKAAVCYEFNKPLVMEDITLREPGKGEVKIRVAVTAICHSDIHDWRGEMPGPTGFIGGHETAGYIDKIGEGVTSVNVGDPVVVSLLASCGKEGTESLPTGCEEVDCSGQGVCGVAPDGSLVCVCDQGYHAEGLACVENVENNPCEGVDCSGHGTCGEDGDDPFCVCDPGYHNQGATNCVADPDPCAGMDCSGHGTCVVTAGGSARCACDAGYHNDGPGSCVPDG